GEGSVFSARSGRGLGPSDPVPRPCQISSAASAEWWGAWVAALEIWQPGEAPAGPSGLWWGRGGRGSGARCGHRRGRGFGRAFGGAARPLVTGASPLPNFERRVGWGGVARGVAALEIRQPGEAPAGPSILWRGREGRGNRVVASAGGRFCGGGARRSDVG